ncbi:hypothetical protein E2C01_062894 [Portunus trituberculatus]|uniref:Uncharacterized protein n=1 Tax=Portunus trituberculatus TaxID=210409 RepID=A0A5B7H946_PORTR|nr:hypothetical protein [Portunus trituberculatus]
MNKPRLRYPHCKDSTSNHIKSIQTPHHPHPTTHNPFSSPYTRHIFVDDEQCQVYVIHTAKTIQQTSSLQTPQPSTPNHAQSTLISIHPTLSTTLHYLPAFPYLHTKPTSVTHSSHNSTQQHTAASFNKTSQSHEPHSLTTCLCPLKYNS